MSEQSRHRRALAAERYRPLSVSCLLVAEAPPAAPDRYFYYEDVPTNDWLFQYVALGVFGAKPSRTPHDKARHLRMLRDRGYFLIDACEDPVSEQGLAGCVPGLVERARALRPDRVILIKTTVFDVANNALLSAGLPVVQERIPFPSSGQQRNFERAFARALVAPPWRLTS
ncbi:hypothetical protein GCM10027047_35710 [Rhodococcus aerolatus]